MVKVTEDLALKGSKSQTIAMLKGGIMFAGLLSSPILLMAFVTVIGSVFNLTGAMLGVVGILTMIVGICGIFFYYYGNVVGLAGKTVLNKLHYETPSNDVGCSPVIETQDYLGIIDGTKTHATFYTYEGDEFPPELLLSPAPPNEIIGQPRRDWIPYKNLIYPASVASVDTVELRKASLGLEEADDYIVSYVQCSSYHATQIQANAGRLLSKGGIFNNPSPSSDTINKAIDKLEESKTVIMKERYIQSERQLKAYKKAVAEGKDRAAQIYGEMTDLEREGKKAPALTTEEKWIQGSNWRKIGVIVTIVSVAVVLGMIAYSVITG